MEFSRRWDFFLSRFMRICNSSRVRERWNRNNNNKLNLILFYIIVQLLSPFTTTAAHCHLSQSTDLLARRWKFTPKQRKTFHYGGNEPPSNLIHQPTRKFIVISAAFRSARRFYRDVIKHKFSLAAAPEFFGNVTFHVVIASAFCQMANTTHPTTTLRNERKWGLEALFSLLG